MTPLELRNEVITAKKKFGQGLITESELYAVADKYIDALKAYKKSKQVKLPIPSRSYLIRAL